MPLMPMGETVFGEVVVQDLNRDLISDFEQLTDQFGDVVESKAGRGQLSVSKRQIEAQLAPEKMVYQVIVTALGPECRTLRVGDVALLPPRKGTMVTIMDEKTGEPERVYAIKESDVLALYRVD